MATRDGCVFVSTAPKGVLWPGGRAASAPRTAVAQGETNPPAGGRSSDAAHHVSGAGNGECEDRRMMTPLAPISTSGGL